MTMQIVEGKYNSAKVFTKDVDEKSLEQIKGLCDQPFSEGAKIRLMPDVHAGAGCTIGTTMTITDKICPNLVGVDIGCGMETIVFHADSPVSRRFDPAKLDKCIRLNIPAGFAIRKFPHKFVEELEWNKIRGKYDRNRARLSLGTLGGGNHFIEADRDGDGNLYIVVHSGSRHAGLEIAEYYQAEAWKQLNGSLVCVGKGNEDWNCSAPHGAGRVMSRGQARRELALDQFKAEMEGIWSTTVSMDTIDESPMAYKTMDSIVQNIGPTADVVTVIKPVYNFKASDEPPWKDRRGRKVR